MARTRTLTQLLADVCERADVTDGGTTGRHTTAFITRHINQAIQQFQRLVTDNGNPTYLKQVAAVTSTSSTVDASNWAPRDYLALPTDFYHLEGIDITNGGMTLTMVDYMTLERNMYKFAPAWLGTDGTGMPVYYKLGGHNAAGSAIVKIIPSADAVYNCVIWYLPIPTDLAAGGDTFDGIAGYEEWVVNRAAMDLLLRDGANQPTYQAIAAENARLESNMVFEFANSAGPGRRLDARALRASIRELARGYWRVP